MTPWRYGSTNKVYFKLTLNKVAVEGITFDAADVKISIDGGAFANIGTECSETTGGLGWYAWQPASAAQTQGKTIIGNIKDDVGAAFDENAFQLITGGSVGNSQLDGS